MAHVKLMDMMDLMYGRQSLDRAHELRLESPALQDHPAALYSVIWRELSLIYADGRGAGLLTRSHAQDFYTRDLAGPLQSFEPIFLGMADGQPRFVIDVSHLEADERGPSVGDDAGEMAFKPLRHHGPLLPVEDGALLAYARGMVLWHRSHRYCGVCGSPTVFAEGGHVRSCANPACGRQHYPRTDPAVIMLVEQGDRILLHRQSVWPKGMWSCLAGFVEPGETLEDAVKREVREESGIEVDRIAYVESQPWPFPSSLMMAFTAQACGGVLAPDTQEIEDARWFRVEDLNLFDDCNRQSGEGLFLAMPGTVARRMVENWIRSRAA